MTVAKVVGNQRSLGRKMPAIVRIAKAGHTTLLTTMNRVVLTSEPTAREVHAAKPSPAHQSSPRGRR